MKSGTVHIPCATCPWLRVNHGKPNPPTHDRLKLEAAHAGEKVYDWYSPANLRRLWDGIRQGEQMICHATDPKAADYGGKNAKAGKECSCVGTLILLKRHLDILNESSSFADYRKRAGRGALTKLGLGVWVNRILFSQTLPREYRDADVALPFESPVNSK